ncbi:MAG: hypothetical protein MI757_06585, partial [Pirellulales bacterium]|nr:hypothetical protein [Pirellulales bacterium]
MDFVWYISACLAIAIALSACAFRLCTLHGASNEVEAAGLSPPGWLRWSAAFGVLACGAWMVQDRLGPAVASVSWDRYLRVAESRTNDESTPGAPAQVDESIAHLESVIRWSPEHPRAHLRLASAYLIKFQQIQNLSDNALPLEQLREAIVRANYFAIAKDSGSDGTREAILQAARKLRNQWLDRTLQFTIFAAETIAKFDNNSNGRLESFEFAKAAESVKPVTGRSISGSLASEDISAAMSVHYRGAHR